MTVLVTVSALFGSYTSVLVVIVSLLLWIILSTPGKTCPFGNHLSKASPSIDGSIVATAEAATSINSTPKKKLIKAKKKCSGKGCTKKINLETKILTIYHAFSIGPSLELALKLQKAAQELGFQSSLTCLEKPFDVDEVLPAANKGANVFILRQSDEKVPTTMEWFHNWLFDAERQKKLLAEMQFAVLGADSSDIQAIQRWDKRLWQLGAQRLKKAGVVASPENCDVWQTEMMCILTGKPAKQCCATTNNKQGGCSSDSSCGSESDNDGSPPLVVDMEDLLLPNKPAKVTKH